MADATITFNLDDVLDVPFSARRVKVWMTFLTDEGWIVDEDGHFRTDAGKATVTDAGLVTLSGVPVPGAGTNPETWQSTIHVEISDVRLPAQRGREKLHLSFGPYTITATADLKDLVEEQYVQPTYVSQVTALLDAKVDEAEGYADDAAASAALAHDISMISTPDGVVEALIQDTGSDTSAALTASYVGYGSDLAAFLAGVPSGQVWRYDLVDADTGDLVDIYSGKVA